MQQLAINSSRIHFEKSYRSVIPFTPISARDGTHLNYCIKRRTQIVSSALHYKNTQEIHEHDKIDAKILYHKAKFDDFFEIALRVLKSKKLVKQAKETKNRKLSPA